MKIYKALSLFCCLVALSSCVFQSTQKRAYKKLEKGKYEKAESLLQKSIKKDSLNPAAHYLLSRLYLDTASWNTARLSEGEFREARTAQQNVDTAQHFILTSLAERAFADKKDLKRLRKIKADSLELFTQLSRVDSAAFQLAAEQHTVGAYNYFLSRYPEAQQVDEATRRRNALAYRAAEEENTYQSYQLFFETYPEASEAPEARERYEELLFIANTKTGTLASYIRFLDEYPATPYRSRLLKNIYQLSTAGHQAEQYAAFIQRYPVNGFTRDAVNQLYHLYKEKNNPQLFLERYPQLPYKDSLEQVIALDQEPLLAVLEKENWQFINTAGNVVLPPVFQDVHPDYTCETILADYVEAFSDGKPLIMAKNGYTILEQDYEMVDDLGYGLLRVQQQGLKGLYLKSGKRLLNPGYEQIERFGDDLIRVKEYGRHGILTHNGQWLAEPKYDSLARLEDFIMLYKNYDFAVTTAERLITALQENRAPELNFRYSMASLSDSSHLILRTRDGLETVIDHNLKTIVAPTLGRISSFTGGWILKNNNRTEILNKDGENLLNATFREVKVKEPWIAYKTDSLWGIYHIGLQKATFDIYDSLTLLHPTIMVAHKGKETTALFMQNDTVTVDLSRIDDYRLLRTSSTFASKQPGQAEQVYLLVTDGNAKKVYNQQGKLIEQGRYKEIVAPDDQLLVLKTARGAAIADSSGAILLKPIYDAVGNYQNGYFATLEKSKFGIFNPYKKVHIPPQYKVALRPYSDSLLMAFNNKGWGIIDHKNKPVLKFEYEELQYWSDSVALARKENQWFLLNLHTGEQKYGPFRDYKILKQSPEESLAQVYTPEGFGVYSSRKGELITPSYDDITNMGSANNPLFYAEKEVKEAGLHVVVYINAEGEPIFKQAYPREEWLKILCE